MQQKLVVRTIGDLEGSSRLVAYCTSCRRSQFLDLEALRKRYGSELRCAASGLACVLTLRSRRPEVMHVWDNGAGYAG